MCSVCFTSGLEDRSRRSRSESQFLGMISMICLFAAEIDVDVHVQKSRSSLAAMPTPFQAQGQFIIQSGAHCFFYEAAAGNIVHLLPALLPTSACPTSLSSSHNAQAFGTPRGTWHLYYLYLHSTHTHTASSACQNALTRSTILYSRTMVKV